jgi:hypothetical protein
MPIIFVVVLRMSKALGYEFDECAARVEFGSTTMVPEKVLRYILLFSGLRNQRYLPFLGTTGADAVLHY